MPRTRQYILGERPARQADAPDLYIRRHTEPARGSKGPEGEGKPQVPAQALEQMIEQEQFAIGWDGQ